MCVRCAEVDRRIVWGAHFRVQSGRIALSYAVSNDHSGTIAELVRLHAESDAEMAVRTRAIATRDAPTQSAQRGLALLGRELLDAISDAMVRCLHYPIRYASSCD
jgi:hypothetical protein